MLPRSHLLRALFSLVLTACSGEQSPGDAASTDGSPPREVLTASDVSMDLASDALADASVDLRMELSTDLPTELSTDVPMDVSTDVSTDVSDVAVEDLVIVMGCPSLTSPVARVGEDPRGDTLAAFAQPFFNAWCLRCHSARRLSATDRMGAPDGFNWDEPSSITAHLAQIRRAVGVDNYMPLTDPKPSCAERRRLVRWVDLGAP